MRAMVAGCGRRLLLGRGERPRTPLPKYQRCLNYPSNRTVNFDRRVSLWQHSVHFRMAALATENLRF